MPRRVAVDGRLGRDGRSFLAGRFRDPQPEERGDPEHHQSSEAEDDDAGDRVKDVDGERLTEGPTGDEDEVDARHIELPDKQESGDKPEDSADDAPLEHRVERGADDRESNQAVDTAAGRPDGEAELIAAVRDQEGAVAQRLSYRNDLQCGPHSRKREVGGSADR